MMTDAAMPDSGMAGETWDGPAPAGPLSFRWASEALVSALAHVLEQHPWAQDRLRMHAGRVIELGAELPSPFERSLPPLRLTVTPLGGFAPAESGETPAVRMRLRPSINAGFAWMRHGTVGLQQHLSLEGDVMLAATIAELAQGLRWDWEDDLSRLVGDVAAHRIGRTVRSVGSELSGLGERIVRMLAASVEQGEAPVVGRSEWALHQAALDALERRIAALERG
jgi:ubiquinone biosynthesis protein UbiJ